jgi:hypothetical protein
VILDDSVDWVGTVKVLSEMSFFISLFYLHTLRLSEWQKTENFMEDDEKASVKFEFFPLEWLISGYRLEGITEDLVTLLEDRKVEYLWDRGYGLDGIDGHDAGRHRTARRINDEMENGKNRGWNVCDEI